MPEERGLYPKMRVAEQLVYFARLHGLDAAAAAAAADGWTERLGVAERRDDAVEKLSAWATSSGSSWPPRWCTTRRCWCWTSRSPGSTRSPWT